MSTAHTRLKSPAEPTLEALGGPGVLAGLRRAWLATRPQFLTASALPVLVGTAWGAGAASALDAWSCALALLGVVLLHAASNVWNDVGDEACGTDRFNTARIYPFTGGSRFIQNRVLSAAQMTRLSVALAAAAGLVGAVLTWQHGWPVLALGLAGGALGALYSWPPAQLAGRGFGEFAVALAFGVLPVFGAAWLQRPVWDAAAALLGVPVAAWVAAILLANEVPDREADARAGKRTLPVRLGVRATGLLYAALHLSAWVGVLAWARLAGLALWPVALFAMLLLPALFAALGIARGGASLPLAIRTTLAIHAAGSLGLASWAALAR